MVLPPRHHKGYGKAEEQLEGPCGEEKQAEAAAAAAAAGDGGGGDAAAAREGGLAAARGDVLGMGIAASTGAAE